VWTLKLRGAIPPLHHTTSCRDMTLLALVGTFRGPFSYCTSNIPRCLWSSSCCLPLVPKHTHTHTHTHTTPSRVHLTYSCMIKAASQFSYPLLLLKLFSSISLIKQNNELTERYELTYQVNISFHLLTYFFLYINQVAVYKWSLPFKKERLTIMRYVTMAGYSSLSFMVHYKNILC